ncbi:hypothetical protein F4678DRAFT_465350 [Xylaria arbuscula]|nr:hypothetical protein F4678DRAFT_465350 [Xylaria arbuscula]
MEPESQLHPSSPSVSQLHRQQHHHHHLPRTPPRSASYYSSSSETYDSSSSIDGALSQLAIQSSISPSSDLITTQGTQLSRPNDQSTSPYHPIIAESRRSSLSEHLGSTSSFNNELSQLAAEHDESSSSQLAAAQTQHSRPPSSPFIATGSSQPWQPSTPRTPSPRLAAPSYYSSSDDDLSSISDMLADDLSHMDDETPQSSQPTANDKQSEPEVASSPVYGSPSSTGKLSWPSPTLTAATYSTSSTSPLSPKSPRSPRLYRTRSGNLASVAELRQRRQNEDEVLDIVLRGIKVLKEVQRPSPQRSVAMSPDESGRWRINSIREDWGP